MTVHYIKKLLKWLDTTPYSPVVLLYGGLSFRGLIPTDSPIFIDDWLKSECQNIDKKKITMDRFLYIDLDQLRL